ncbi:DNA-dependent RNA polymerase I [Phaffia rhodozyma]|uniref:DNA-dependent RNA polymerase I n=1 Tax=Phaffia rhodozyma TaxID=264483 RepID=A0A0F7SF69_PHARH|nr:DNA-dependent RNA polymerase I [Phaffia rhodozyma]
MTHPSSTQKKSSKKPANAKASSSSSGSDSEDVTIHSPFTYQATQMKLSVPPAFVGNLRGGVAEMLDSLVMKYVPKLQGVLLSHSNLQFMSPVSNVLNDCPFAISDVQFGAIIWAPKTGQTLEGTHSISSPSHISLLIHKTFNVSIPMHHIPSDEYYFDPSLADTPPTPEPEPILEETDETMAEGEQDGQTQVEEDVAQAKGKAKEVIQFSTGRWRSRVTGKILGEDDEKVKFTVIDLNVSSQILSLTGSLLPEPFSIPIKPSSTDRADSPSHLTNGNLDSAEYDNDDDLFPLPSASVYANDPAALESEEQVAAVGEDGLEKKLTWKEQAAKADAEDQAFRMARAERKRAKQAAKLAATQEKEEEATEEGRAAKRAKVVEEGNGEPIEVADVADVPKRSAEKKVKVGSRKSKKAGAAVA